MAHPKRYPPCIHCGAQQAKPSVSYYANDGEIPCWDLKCGWCGKHYQAAMLPLPASASMSALDEGIRLMRRDQARRRFGYVPGGEKDNNRGPKRISSDRIHAEITIHPGYVQPNLRTRLERTRAHFRPEDRRIKVA